MKYLIMWEEIKKFSIEVEADSKEDAESKVLSSDHEETEPNETIIDITHTLPLPESITSIFSKDFFKPENKQASGK